MDQPTEFKIEITTDGPYVVTGGVPLAKQHIVPSATGESIDWREGQHYPVATRYALCRCGKSATKPFCDNSHAAQRFDGTETASRKHYIDQAQETDGPTMELLDAERLCASARFCDVKGSIWKLIGITDHAKAQHLVMREAGNCPSGRLVVLDAERKALEPTFSPSIGLIEDTAMQVAGPLWVRGGIPIMSSKGDQLEVRNRVTLCRCGASQNKPYCDGTHVSIQFQDEKRGHRRGT